MEPTGFSEVQEEPVEKELPVEQEQAGVGVEGEEVGEVKEVREVEEVEEVKEVEDGEVVADESVQGTAQVVVDPLVAEDDRLTKEVESIMEEDFTDIFLSMPPDKQQEFKETGEETLSKIRQLLESTKINAKKIFQLLRDWMKIIPGVDRFFLEQEAKIKTDKILFISEEEKKRSLDEIE